MLGLLGTLFFADDAFACSNRKSYKECRQKPVDCTVDRQPGECVWNSFQAKCYCKKKQKGCAAAVPFMMLAAVLLALGYRCPQGRLARALAGLGGAIGFVAGASVSSADRATPDMLLDAWLLAPLASTVAFMVAGWALARSPRHAGTAWLVPVAGAALASCLALFPLPVALGSAEDAIRRGSIAVACLTYGLAGSGLLVAFGTFRGGEAARPVAPRWTPLVLLGLVAAALVPSAALLGGLDDLRLAWQAASPLDPAGVALGALFLWLAPRVGRAQPGCTSPGALVLLAGAMASLLHLFVLALAIGDGPSIAEAVLRSGWVVAWTGALFCVLDALAGCWPAAFQHAPGP